MPRTVTNMFVINQNSKMVYSVYSVLCVDYRDKKAKDVSCDTIETKNCLFCTYIAFTKYMFRALKLDPI